MRIQMNSEKQMKNLNHTYKNVNSNMQIVMRDSKNYKN